MKPTLNTLSDAYIVLDDLGLSGFLDGWEMEINVNELARALLRERKLQLFISIVSGKSEDDCGDLTIDEAIKEILSFFETMRAQLLSLQGFAPGSLKITKENRKTKK